MKSVPKEYNHKKIEEKWQKEWEKKGAFEAVTGDDKPKKYVLSMFPYPSGAGLHVGHPRGYIANDVYARLMRSKGFNVLHPMGFDSFGLPAEQYAIKTGNNPKVFTDKLVKQYRKQLDIIGFGYDWSREISTHRPEYYRWTQWIFLKLYNSWYNKSIDKAEPIESLINILEKSGNENLDAVCDDNTEIVSAKKWKEMNDLQKENLLMKYRLAYEGFSEVNWCPELGTVLANDEIVNGPDGKPVSERGSFPVEKKSLRQWFLRITAYADRLLSGHEEIDWPNHIKEIQKNWIGKSEGSQVAFKLLTTNYSLQTSLEVFTTRVDTLFGVTYVVLAPELAERFMINDSGFKNQIKNIDEVLKYIAGVKNKTIEDRTAENKDKTGVVLNGVTAINPANGEEVPVWIADYVLASYGTGAVMAVPAHDERDYEFAKKYGLPIKNVIEPVTGKPLPNSEFRKSIVAIVEDVKNKRILTLNWTDQYGGYLFIGGGLEGDEDPIDTARREIAEETGYKNLEFVARSGKSHHHYFAFSKNVARQIEVIGVHFRLVDDEADEQKLEENEKDRFTVEWLPIDEAENKVKDENHALYFQKFIRGKIYENDGILTNSGKFDGFSSLEARKEITNAVGGKIVTKYKMRDAVFARQRYWGEPIPLIHEKDGTITPLSEKQLPLELPNVKSYAPTGNAESPLGSVKDWVKNGYETNTMPGWAGSSWYFLRYMDPNNKKTFADPKALEYWGQVDMYVGGAEHATGHLLYSRFWNNFLYDLGLVPHKEPFKVLKNQGMILGADHRKMSKRWGNVVNPDDVVKNYGADTLRVFEMFIGPFESQLPWSTDGIIGSRRFVERVWRLQEKISDDENVYRAYENTLHKTIKKVSEDIESFNFNTAISAMMICLNEMEKSPLVFKSDFEKFLQILSPFAPHITEEIWANLNHKKLIQDSGWPEFDPTRLVNDTITLVVQVNGKVRGELNVGKDISENEALELVKSSEQISKWLLGSDIIKVVFVPGRLINIVIKVTP